MSIEMKKPPEVIRGDNARVIGYACRVCGMLWMEGKHEPDPERRAAHCCEPNFCEDCKAPVQKHYIRCNSCSYVKRLNKWLESKTDVPWNGEFPIFVWDVDKLLWDADDLFEYVQEHEEGDLEFVSADPVVPRSFEVHDFLSDDLFEDIEMEGDWKRFDAFVNRWIQKYFPKHYEGGNRITESVLEFLKKSEVDHGVGH